MVNSNGYKLSSKSLCTTKQEPIFSHTTFGGQFCHCKRSDDLYYLIFVCATTCSTFFFQLRVPQFENPIIFCFYSSPEICIDYENPFSPNPLSADHGDHPHYQPALKLSRFPQRIDCSRACIKISFPVLMVFSCTRSQKIKKQGE
ncbi:hypothetical protein Pfo_025429 [Paulownia fortunei]|nr:hypothetical protein Pfo_025429 [Paulownia fortunei]